MSFTEASSQRPGLRVWGVQPLLLAVSDLLGARFGAVAVEGEVSAFTRAASGHCYFTLKDHDGGTATLRCAMFRRAASMLAFAPRDGMQVVLRGRLALYEARGELQLVVESMSAAGEGALYERFLRLKATLESDGLFDVDRKRALPPSPARVGVVTSLAAAALHDVATTLARRAPHVHVVVYPTPVQGADAPPEIVAALARAVRRDEVDVLLLVRGGGSLEDLWAFNDERVVRAVAASSIPIVVGVGHESDITLADLAADVRAPTPTAAAELAVPAREALLSALLDHASRAHSAAARRIEQHMLRLDRAAQRAGRPSLVLAVHRTRLDRIEARLVPSLRAAAQTRAHRIDTLHARIDSALRSRLVHARHALDQRQARLDALDPTRVLARGFAWIAGDDGKPIVSAARLERGMHVAAVLADGTAHATIDDVQLDRRDDTHDPT